MALIDWQKTDKLCIKELHYIILIIQVEMGVQGLGSNLYVYLYIYIYKEQNSMCSFVKRNYILSHLYMEEGR